MMHYLQYATTSPHCQKDFLLETLDIILKASIQSLVQHHLPVELQVPESIPSQMQEREDHETEIMATMLPPTEHHRMREEARFRSM